MTFFLTLSRGESAACVKRVARTSDPDMIRYTIAGLHRNWVLDDDGRDRIDEPGFMDAALDEVAALTESIRQAGCRQPVDESHGEKDGLMPASG